MTTNYENLQPPKRLENHELCHISSLVRQPEIESGDKFRHFQSLMTTIVEISKRQGSWRITIYVIIQG
jgi:hypothetical protein